MPTTMEAKESVELEPGNIKQPIVIERAVRLFQNCVVFHCSQEFLSFWHGWGKGSNTTSPHQAMLEF